MPLSQPRAGVPPHGPPPAARALAGASELSGDVDGHWPRGAAVIGLSCQVSGGVLLIGVLLLQWSQRVVGGGTVAVLSIQWRADAATGYSCSPSARPGSDITSHHITSPDIHTLTARANSVRLQCSQGQPCTNCARRFPQPICDYTTRTKRYHTTHTLFPPTYTLHPREHQLIGFPRFPAVARVRPRPSTPPLHTSYRARDRTRI